MKNIVIFSDNASAELEKTLSANNDDCDVRVKNIEEVKDAQKFSPSVIEPLDEKELNLRLKNLLKIKELKETINQVSTTDALTGLHNRRFLHERLEAEISRSKRYDTKLSCLLLDIDFFKVVNDMYGYDWGDVLLKKIAEMLKGFIRKEDILTRYGDEEFIGLLPNTPEENAFIFAERFRREIEKMEFIPAGEEERHPITISGGIASYPFLQNAEEDTQSMPYITQKNAAKTKLFSSHR